MSPSRRPLCVLLTLDELVGIWPGTRRISVQTSTGNQLDGFDEWDS